MPRKSTLAAPAEIAPSGQALDTPFLRARREWDARIGTPVVQKQNWQRIAGGLTIAVVALAGGWLMGTPKVQYVPYVVEVAETGQVRTVGILPQQWQGQDMRPVEFLVREWLDAVRTISTDPVVFGHNMDKAKSWMTGKGWAMLGEYVKAQYERQKRGEVVQVKFGNFLPIAGHARSYSLEWEEKAYGQQGFLLQHDNWKATLKIAILPPQTIKEGKDMRNPLGMFIEEVTWTERTRSSN